MGLWPTKKALQTWIKYNWKPKGSIDLHLGSKGFFTMVFTNIEDKDRVFEGGPYFYAVAGLYMRLWMMNFVPERETFTSVLVWVRLYSLPLDYWQIKSLSAIGNKLGRFVKASEATKRGKYTSFARVCVEMDLSGALPDEVILEVFDEEWVQTLYYEHIPFRCRRGKGGKREPKQHQTERQQASLNKFQVLKEEEEITKAEQVMEGSPVEKEKEEDGVKTQDINKQKETMMNDAELEMDQEMT
eukprot:PITA_25496